MPVAARSKSFAIEPEMGANSWIQTVLSGKLKKTSSCAR